MARKDELLQELQRGGAGLRDSASLGASSGIEDAASTALASTARGEARSARLAALAQETVRSLQAKTKANPNPNPNPNRHPHPHPNPNSPNPNQAKTRRQEEAISRYQQLLADAREALQREKLASAAQLDGMSEKLYQRQALTLTLTLTLP